MNVLSLYDGMSCGRIALDATELKIENYFSSEIKDYAIEVADKNYPQDSKNRLGDITKIKGKDLPKIDLMIGGSPCFVGDTLIQTDKGLVEIKDIKVGDSVLTHTGKYQKVLNIGGKHNQPIWKVKGMGTDGVLTTYNHPFYIRERYKKWNNKRRSYDRLFKQPTWVETTKLTKDTYLASVIQSQSIPVNNIRDVVFWEFVGRVTADGWALKYKRKNRKNGYQYKVYLSCGKHEVNIVTELMEKLGYHYSITEERTVYKFLITNQKLYNYMSKIGKGASNKIVHPDIWMLPTAFKQAYLKGYLDGDGCYIEGTKNYQATTVSRKLAYGVHQLIIDTLQVPVKMTKHVPPKTTVIEGRVVNQKPTYLIKYKLGVHKQDQAFNDGTHIWKPLQKAEETSIIEDVYNIEVAIDNSYTANGIVVHNCQDFSGANRSREGLEGTKSGLFYEYVRLLEECKPTYFLLENVRMKKEHQDIISEALGVEPLVINSEVLAPQLRHRLYWTNIPNLEEPEGVDKVLNDYLVAGYSDRRKARALLESDSRPLSTPIKMAHRYFNTGFTTLIFKDEKHYNDIKDHFDINFKGKSAKEIGDLAKDMDLSLYDGVRYMNNKEREACQTVPKGYTDILTQNQSACILGDGWTIDVITHLLKQVPIKKGK